jgi:sterol desaturase/sphingolipid hydroxylase (fatty acid hydroxylase superfamily)
MRGSRRALFPSRFAKAAAVLLAVLLLVEGVLAGLEAAFERMRRLDALPAFALDSLSLYAHIVLIALVLLGLEMWKPGSRAPRRYGQAALFWALYVPVAVLAANIGQALVERYEIEPLLRLDPGFVADAGVPAWLVHGAVIALGAAVFDFFYYWFHRVQHAVPVLWAFHSAHHANRSLNALGCYHHPVEDLWRIPLFVLPMAATVQVVAPELFLLTAFVTGWGLFNHADTRFNLGPLRGVLADNHYHRIHHSAAEEHHGSNFAGMFSLWDKVFGTQCMPQPGAERLPVGLRDLPHPETLAQFVATPIAALRSRGGEGAMGLRQD